MYKYLPISAAFCLFLFTSGFNCDADLNDKSSRFDPLPNCSEAMKQNETMTQLANCPPISAALNLSDPADCCQFWRSFNCEKDILYQLPECSSSRFLIEMQVNIFKPAGTCVGPPLSCANVMNNRAITTVTEDLFRPLTQFHENATTFGNCTDDFKDGFVNCLLHFENLLDQRQAHPDAAICCDELDFKDCVKNLTDSQATCSPFKSDFDSLYTTMEKNVAKKCPTMGFHCYRSGASTVSLAFSVFTFSLIVAFLVRNV